MGKHKKYRTYQDGGQVGNFLDFLEVLPGAPQEASGGGGGGFGGKLLNFLGSDTGKGILSGLGGLFERGRAKRELEAGLDYRRGQMQEQFDEGTKAYEQQLAMLRDTPAVTQATLDAADAQKQAAEALLGGVDRRGQERRSDIVSAAQSADPRSTAGLLRTLEQYDSGEDAARLAALQSKADAEKIPAALEEEGRQFQRGLEKELMDRAGVSADEARRSLMDITTAEEAAGPQATASGLQTAASLFGLLNDPDYGNPGEAREGMRYMGDKGFKTKGEFSHKTNKKAVIDEEDGEKEAELTGGELVFNPKQVSEMENLIEEGDAKELLMFMKDLLSQPQFKD
tara:strand:- start:1817 stop:2839 length:1023 start_codon:yes stop_codon:yes gene_type:complete